MALIRNFTLDGVNYPEAYSRILVARCDKLSASIYVCTYATEGSRMANEDPVWTEEHIAPIEQIGSPVFSSCYDFLKSRPGFESAIDHDNTPVPDVIDTTAEVVGEIVN